MREVALDFLAALPVQSLAAFSPDALAIGVHCGFLRRRAMPVFADEEAIETTPVPS